MKKHLLAVLFLVPVTFLCLLGMLSAQSETEIRDLITRAGGAQDHPGADLVRVFDRTDVDVEASGLSHIRNHSVTKVLSAKGCLDLAALRYDYDPATNFVEIRKLRIFRAGGEVQELDTGAYSDAVQPAHGIYWGMRMKVVSISRLEVGDAVEVATYKKGFLIAYLDQQPEDSDERFIPPMRGHYYDMILFEETIPIEEKTYTVHTVKSRPLMFDVFNGECFTKTVFDDEKFHYTWSKRSMPAVHDAPRSPDRWDFVTKVVMATVQSWQEKSRWFEEANRNQFDSNAAIQAMVDEVVAGLESDDEKATALLRWVANNIRYSGLNMGKGEGYTLHPGWMIFEERCGVCKDIAGMLVTMLRAAGIPAYPAMTMAGARVEYIPADQFNHCVVARKMPDGSYKMYDPTWCPLSMTDWSLAEAEQHYVVGSPEGEELDAIQYYPPEGCLMRIDSKGKLAGDGTLEGTMLFQGRGYSDTYLRRVLTGYNSRRAVEPALEGWLLRLSPRAELLGWEASDYRDLSKPVTIEISYRIPGYALVYGDSSGCGGCTGCGCSRKSPTLELHSPATRLMVNQLVRAESTTRTPTRSLPLFLYLAARNVVEETIELPEGYSLSQAAAARSLDGPAADLTTKVTDENGSLQVSFSVAVKSRNTLPENYPQLYDVMQEMRAFKNETITLAR